MTHVNQSRKAALLKAMKLIRPVFQRQGYAVDAYTNNAIADALLHTCPQMDGSWLSPKHLRSTVRRLQVTGRRRSVSPWLQAFGFGQRPPKPSV